MTWASHPTSEMPRVRRRRPWALVLVVLLLIGVAAIVARALLPKTGVTAAPATTSLTAAVVQAAGTPSVDPEQELRIAEDETLALVNAVRAQHDCPALRVDPILVLVARAHSDVMAQTGQYSHLAPDGKDPAARMEAAGYATDLGWAENIARRQSTAAMVVDEWVGTEANRAIIIDCALVATGIAVARDGEGALYWTQEFGGR